MPRLELWRPKKKADGAEGSPEARRTTSSDAGDAAAQPRVSTWPRLFRLASLLLETSC